jgi:succinate dehydrogenase (ubiquinone) cytochrome b560 subunit
MTKTSPHVSIYRFPLTAISSITNRATGLALSGLYITSGTALLFDKNLMQEYDKFNKPIKTIVNYTVLFPSIYHSLGGIRHMVWDKYPSLLKNTKVFHSSIGIFALSTIGTFCFEKYILKNNIKNIM